MLTDFGRSEFNPDDALTYELHEFTRTKIIKSIGLCFWMKIFLRFIRDLIDIFGFIRVIRSFMHYLN